MVNGVGRQEWHEDWQASRFSRQVSRQADRRGVILSTREKTVQTRKQNRKNKSLKLEGPEACLYHSS